MIESKTLRVYRVVNPPQRPKHYIVNSVEEAVKKIQELTQKDLKDECVGMNVFGLEEYDYEEEIIRVKPKQKWQEWYDEGGFDIIQIMDGESDYYNSEGKKIMIGNEFDDMPYDPGFPEKDDQRS